MNGNPPQLHPMNKDYHQHINKQTHKQTKNLVPLPEFFLYLCEEETKGMFVKHGCKVIDSFKYLSCIYLYACEYLTVGYHLRVWMPLEAWVNMDCREPDMGC